MPRGPKGEKRPADVIGNAVKVMRIAVGEEAEETSPNGPRGQAGGIARANNVTPTGRKKIAVKAAKARWAKNPAREKTEQ